MPTDNGFKHLPFPTILIGKPKYPQIPFSGNAQTANNARNRITHGENLKQKSVQLSRFWKERHAVDNGDDFQNIAKGMPLLLQIDPDADPDFLRGLGFEIVSEIENGFIVVASEDFDLVVFNQKLDEFINCSNKRCNSPAKIYALFEEKDRIKKVLSHDLYEKWHFLNLDELYIVDIGVSCCGDAELPKRPEQIEDETNEHFLNKLEKWNIRFSEAYERWDSIKLEREIELENFVQDYNGEILAGFVDGSAGEFVALPDSFSTRLKISGKGLRDLVLNFAYVFEVSECEPVVMEIASPVDSEVSGNVEFLSPDASDPIVCVMDSGIQEAHKYLAPAIKSSDSKSLVIGNSSVNDEVSEGGHGTRVAGAILYPCYIPTNGVYKLPCWIRNLRILNEFNSLEERLFPPEIIKFAVSQYFKNQAIPSKIFNHSVGSYTPFHLDYMTAWAASIDLQTYENDVLFIQACGNIEDKLIIAYLKMPISYPDYLDQDLCRLSDPGQSLQALTVGSVALSDFENDDFIALGKKDEVSSFSRSGPGIWDSIKPDVVEYGGTDVLSKAGNPLVLTSPSEVCPELIRKSPTGPAYAKDVVGTSFSTPKVSYIAACLQKNFPKASSLLYRALIAQSARWPIDQFTQDRSKATFLLRHIGYGIPNIERAIQNDEYRITLITESEVEIQSNTAHVYRIPIPQELSSIGDDFDILLEITLSYSAKPRRTRRTVRRYLSTWLDWCCSRIGESADIFSRRIFETGKSVEDDGSFKWMIGERPTWGSVNNYSRSKSTLQKDWCLVKSNELNDAFCIAVRGHKGWGDGFKAKYALAVSFEAINHDVEIYEPIRSRIEMEVSVPVDEIEVQMHHADFE